MFSELIITDILGSEIINNNTPLIIISASSVSLEQYLNLVTTIDSSKIYKLNHELLVKNISTLSDKLPSSFNITNFIPVGDICSSTRIKSIVLANKYILPTTNKFRKVGNLAGLTFWVGYLKRKDKESRTLGVCTTTNNNPPDHRVPVLPRSYLIKMDFPTGKVAGNELNILNIKSDGLWMILRHKFTRGNNNFKLIGLNGKYLSSDNNKLQLKEGNTTNQNVSYNVQGELVMGNMCITTNDNKEVYLEKCSKKSGQKWSPYNGNYISMMDNKFNTCLSVGNRNNIVASECDPRKESEWTQQDIDGADIANYTWPTAKGKTVVLVEKDDPWFLNKDIVGNVTHVPHKFSVSAPYDTSQAHTSESKYNKTPTDFIRGYSYAEQAKNIEGFGDTENNNDTFSIILLIIIILILFIVKIGYFQKKY